MSAPAYHDLQAFAATMGHKVGPIIASRGYEELGGRIAAVCVQCQLLISLYGDGQRSGHGAATRCEEAWRIPSDGHMSQEDIAEMQRLERICGVTS